MDYWESFSQFLKGTSGVSLLVFNSLLTLVLSARQFNNILKLNRIFGLSGWGTITFALIVFSLTCVHLGPAALCIILSGLLLGLCGMLLSLFNRRWLASLVVFASLLTSLAIVVLRSLESSFLLG
jgi:hypothetical protein